MPAWLHGSHDASHDARRRPPFRRKWPGRAPCTPTRARVTRPRRSEGREPGHQVDVERLSGRGSQEAKNRRVAAHVLRVVVGVRCQRLATVETSDLCHLCQCRSIRNQADPHFQSTPSELSPARIGWRNCLPTRELARLPQSVHDRLCLTGGATRSRRGSWCNHVPGVAPPSGSQRGRSDRVRGRRRTVPDPLARVRRRRLDVARVSRVGCRSDRASTRHAGGSSRRTSTATTRDAPQSRRRCENQPSLQARSRAVASRPAAARADAHAARSAPHEYGGYSAAPRSRLALRFRREVATGRSTADPSALGRARSYRGLYIRADRRGERNPVMADRSLVREPDSIVIS